jgi:hypothetical protein
MVVYLFKIFQIRGSNEDCITKFTLHEAMVTNPAQPCDRSALLSAFHYIVCSRHTDFSHGKVMLIRNLFYRFDCLEIGIVPVSVAVHLIVVVSHNLKGID